MIEYESIPILPIFKKIDIGGYLAAVLNFSHYPMNKSSNYSKFIKFTFGRAKT